MPDLLPIIGTVAGIGLFLYFLRRPRLWELEALDRLVRENPAWSKYRDPIRTARAGSRRGSPEERSRAAQALQAARAAGGTQVHAYLMWQRIPRQDWQAALRDERRRAEIAEDLGAAMALDREVLTADDLARRADLLRAFGRSDLAAADTPGDRDPWNPPPGLRA